MENTNVQEVKMPITYDDLKKSLVDSGRPYDFAMIDRAYALAEKAHGEQRRRSGEPYICHPLSVAQILVELGMDSESIAAALMHDVAEDTPVTVAEIKQKFGPEVALLVDGVTKLTQIKFSNVEDRKAENLRKMLLAMSQDVRVMIIKLCDRLHNMRTGDAWPEQKRRDKALETMEVYAPIAHRLGISNIKEELEDRSLQYLDPVGYNMIRSLLNKHGDDFLNDICATIQEHLEQNGIHGATIRHRVKIGVGANGGNMDNAICREAEAVVVVAPEQVQTVAAVIEEAEAMFREEYKDRESDILMTAEQMPEAAEVLTTETRDYVIALLRLLPYGVQTMDTNMDGLVETSSNIGILKTNEDHIFIDNAVRGSMESRKDAICKKIEVLGSLCGAKVVGVHDYPGWQYNPNSEMLRIFKEVWVEKFGEEPKVVAIHAGLECGLFAKKIPGLDLISLGPNMYDVHTPDERLSISSTIRIWEYLKLVLARLK